MVKISVIMPVFNEEEYLLEAIGAFEAQTISSECELICVDDGSTDSSTQILEAAQDTYSANIRVLRQRNLGSGPARNAGIDAARGDYIAFLDADDSYPANDVLESMYNVACEKGFDVVGGSLERLIDGKRYRHHFEGPFAKYYEGDAFDQDGEWLYSDYQFDYAYYRFIYRKVLLDQNNIRFPAYLRFQDPPFMVQALDAAGRFYGLQRTTYTYRSNAGKVNWDRRKAEDLLRGVADVGNFAESRGYPILLDTCIYRLSHEFVPKIKPYLFANRDWKLMESIDSTRKSLIANSVALGCGYDERLDKYYVQDLIDEIEKADAPVKAGVKKLGHMALSAGRKAKRTYRAIKKTWHSRLSGKGSE